MSGNRHIVCARMMGQQLKDIQIKLVRGLLDIVVLQLLRTHPMHGYPIITSLRKNFGVYFGPSTIYPLLCLLEEKGYINSQWNLESACARAQKKLLDRLQKIRIRSHLARDSSSELAQRKRKESICRKNVLRPKLWRKDHDGWALCSKPKRECVETLQKCSWF